MAVRLSKIKKQQKNWKNLPALLLEQKKKRPRKKGLFVKRHGVYSGVTYKHVYSTVEKLGVGLKALGIDTGDAVGLLSNNRPEWVYSDMAILGIGGVNVPIYPTLTAKEIQYILTDCGAKAVIVETQEHLEKVTEIIGDCPQLTHVIAVINGISSPLPGFQSMEAVIKQGAGILEKDKSAFEKLLNLVTRDQLASIVYTSGTTGTPKGVMLSHGNFLANVEDVLAAIPFSEKEVVLSFLPLSHVFERTAGYYTLISLGATIYYAESIDTVSENIQEARPTVLVSVPRLYEKIQAKILDGLTGIKKPIFTWAMKVGREYHRGLKNGHNGVSIRLNHQLADRLVYHKIKAKTGGRLRFFVSGGAPLGKELGRFFECLDLLIIEGYGLTESAPIIACNRPDDYRMGTVGKKLPSQTVKLGSDGELLVKGPNVMMGYFNHPEATREVIKDGWLHTGDIAEIDDKGFIRIVDRKKELIVLSNGKKVAPQVIERALSSSQFVSQVILIGEKRNYLSALIVPHMVKLKKYAEKQGFQYTDEQDLVDQTAIYSFYEGLIGEKLKDYASFERVKKFRFLAQELSHEGGELTVTLKPRRRVIAEKSSGRSNPPPISEIERADVLLARIVPGITAASISFRTFFLISIDSTTASITISASLNPE